MSEDPIAEPFIETQRKRQKKIQKRVFLSRKNIAENTVDGHLNNILGYDWQSRFPKLLTWFEKRDWRLSHNALGVGLGLGKNAKPMRVL